MSTPGAMWLGAIAVLLMAVLLAVAVWALLIPIAGARAKRQVLLMLTKGGLAEGRVMWGGKAVGWVIAVLLLKRVAAI